ncbi:MAG TPA: DUF2723 domain-containing protein [Anaerolineales bacterium]|nr:DUF2723 domain-containing protein [Anaerolineales bacterium]
MHPSTAIPLKLRFKLDVLGGPRERETLTEIVFSASVFILPLLTYLLTLSPTVYALDSAELTIAATTGGLMRATGYPLYLLLGRIWSLIPFGDMGFRMNLFSAVCGALGVWIGYRIMRRLGAGRLAAAGAAGLMAAAPIYWSLSLIAEVYTLQVVLMGIQIVLLLRWADNPTALNLSLVAGWIGLSLGHHLATVLLVPGAVLFVNGRAGRRIFLPGNLLGSAAAFLAGISIYLYLPLLYAADPVFNYAGLFDDQLVFHPVDLQSVSGMWWLVTGRAFASRMFAYQGAAFLHEALFYAGSLGRAFLFIGILPGLIGLWALLRRDRLLAGMLLLMFGLSAYFFIDYAVVDKETMFLPTYLVWAIFAGVGYQTLEDRAPAGRGRAVLHGAILGTVLIAAAVTGPAVDLSGNRAPREAAERILVSVEPEAVIFGWWETIPPIQYLQLVEGQRPDVEIVNRFLVPRKSMYLFVQREIDRRPIYIDVFPEEWTFVFKPVPAGRLFRLERIVHPDRTGVRIGGY